MQRTSPSAFGRGLFIIKRMNITNRVDAFSSLGSFLKQFITKTKKPELSNLNNKFYEEFILVIEQAEIHNRWFIKDNILQAIEAWANSLTEGNLQKWIAPYSFNKTSKKVGVIQAGNIPLVGFHDFLSVLISGHIFIGKASSKDDKLPQIISKILIEIEPRFKTKIFWEERLNDIDAIIATGSDNSSRYFEYYFGDKPNIIRKNRSSWAVITGKESKNDLYNLGKDIFAYYGLGCRNISKLFVPDNYDFKPFFEAVEPFQKVYNNNKYANNYDYNQSVYLMNLEKFLQNGFVMLKEETGHHSPLSVIYYEQYSKIETVQSRIENQKNEIQCICCLDEEIPNAIPFGKTQEPDLWDYADQIDTLKFLSEL